jgi:hypothetical protein
MGVILGFIILGGIIFFSLLYYIVRGAVEDGTLNALIKYESIKNHQNKSGHDEL